MSKRRVLMDAGTVLSLAFVIRHNARNVEFKISQLSLLANHYIRKEGGDCTIFTIYGGGN